MQVGCLRVIGLDIRARSPSTVTCGLINRCVKGADPTDQGIFTDIHSSGVCQPPPSLANVVSSTQACVEHAQAQQHLKIREGKYKYLYPESLAA